MAASANITRRSILKTATAISLAAPMAAVAEEPEHLDYPLLMLSDLLEQAQVEMDRLADFGGEDRAAQVAADAKYEAAHDKCTKLLEQIESTPARTLDGLRVKARAIEWCYCGSEICLNEQLTTDVRLAHQIIRALLEA